MTLLFLFLLIFLKQCLSITNISIFQPDLHIAKFYTSIFGYATFATVLCAILAGMRIDASDCGYRQGNFRAQHLSPSPLYSGYFCRGSNNLQPPVNNTTLSASRTQMDLLVFSQGWFKVFLYLNFKI